MTSYFEVMFSEAISEEIKNSPSPLFLTTLVDKYVFIAPIFDFIYCKVHSAWGMSSQIGNDKDLIKM